MCSAECGLPYSALNLPFSRYEVLVNGKNGCDFAEAAQDVDDALEGEEWWVGVQNLRKPHGITTSRVHTQASDLLIAVANWPTSSFQHGRRVSRPKRFAELKKVMNKNEWETPSSDHEGKNTPVCMRNQILPKDASLEGNSDDENSLHPFDAGEHGYHAGPVNFNSDTGTDNDMDEYDLDASDSEHERHLGRLKREKIPVATRDVPFISRTLGIR